MNKDMDILTSLRDEPQLVELNRVADAIGVLARYYRDNHMQVEMKGVHGAPDWLAYEMRLWELSELIRNYLKVHRELRGPGVLFDRIADVIARSEFGKGRQNFTLLLGQYGGATYAGVIGGLLDDLDVAGHAVKAISELRVPGYSAQMKIVLTEVRIGWIRAAARAYLRAMGERRLSEGEE